MQIEPLVRNGGQSQGQGLPAPPRGDLGPIPDPWSRPGQHRLPQQGAASFVVEWQVEGEEAP
jgi:hypothetical protein